VQAKLMDIMARKFNAIYESAAAENIDMRSAAYAHALNRIGAAVESQGTSRYFANHDV